MSLHWPVMKLLETTRDSLGVLRRRIIRDTERYINAGMRGEREAWPRPDVQPTRVLANLPVASVAAPVVTAQSAWVTVLEVQADRGGELDEARVRRLIDPLYRLIWDHCRGDVVVDLSHVRLLSKESLELLAALERRMRRQRRRLLLCGLDDECAGVRRVSGLGIICYRSQRDAVDYLFSRNCL